MISELHGKVYYAELGENFQLVNDIVNYINEDDRFLELRGLLATRKIDKTWIIYSTVPVESFRGKKYRQWEKLKVLIYKLKKES